MHYENITLVKEYYEKVKHLYPDLSFKDFAEICQTPMNYVKHNIRSDEMPRIRIKNFGKFRVDNGKVEYMIRNYKDRYAKGLATFEDTTKAVQRLRNYQERIKISEKF